MATRRAVDPIAVTIWLAACAVATFFAVILVDSAIIDGLYIPRTNDSLYHGSRILDAAVGSRGFYEYDERLHVPEGAWVSWPYAYDYLMGRLAAFGVWLDPSSDPLAVVFFVPVAWILVNAALFLAICRAIGLSIGMQALAMFCFALSPLTQLLHSVGMLDHHYVEHTFVLLVVWLGVRWFQNLESRGRAITLGAALGLAPAFHNLLFILQLFPLCALFIMWLRRAALPRASLQSFAIALVSVTQLVLLPSEPYRRGMFEFGLLSWFHFYVAVCSGVATLFLSRTQRTPRHAIWLSALCLALALPLAPLVFDGLNYLSGSFSIIDQIVEVQSPYRLFITLYGPAQTASYYSWLLLAAPVLALYFAYRVARETVADRVYFAFAAAFGLMMLLAQFRFQYFGWFALVMGPLLAVDALRARLRWHAGATFAATLAALTLAFQPALRDRLFIAYAPGSAPDYASVLPLYLDLMKLCAVDPGVVLAHSDDGSGILFHTECGVISNNFILRPDDAKYIDELYRIFQLAPEEVVQQRPDIKYFLLRARDFMSVVDERVELSPDSAIAQQLLTDNAPPPGFQVIKTIKLKTGPTADDEVIFARLYRVQAAAPSAVSTRDSSAAIAVGPIPPEGSQR